MALAACSTSERPFYGNEADDTPDGSNSPDGGTNPVVDGGNRPDSDGGSRPDPDGGPVEGNRAPRVVPATPADSAGPVPVAFTVVDDESDPVYVLVERSESFGAWAPATAAPGTRVSGLESSPGGVVHTFNWSSDVDVPGRAASVRIRFTPFDARRGEPVATQPFVVDNAPSTRTPPSIADLQVASTVRGDANIAFDAVDGESEAVSITVEWRAGSTWSTATMAASSGPRQGLSSSPTGVAHSLTWASAADLPQQDADGVRLRLTPRDAHGSGVPVESVPFSVRNAPAPLHPGLKIAEIFAGTGDWFEVLNTGSAAINLAGWKLHWEEVPALAGDVLVPATPARTVAPGARMVVSEENCTTSATKLCLNLGTSGIGWASGLPGAAMLVDPSGNAVDFVRWGGSPSTPPDSTGWSEPPFLHIPSDAATLSRRGSSDTDSSDDFCAAAPSPGAAPSACLQAPSPMPLLLISEVFAGGYIDTGTVGDWVEIVNAGGSSAAVGGWVVVGESNDPTSLPPAVVLHPMTLPPGGRLVVFAGSGTDSGSGTASAVQYTGDQSRPVWVAGAAGAASLRDPTGAPHDYVRWGGWSEIVPPPLVWTETAQLSSPGRATTLARRGAVSVAVASAEWCIQQPSPGGAGNGCMPPPPPSALLISEIAAGQMLADGGAVEIVNRGNTYVPLDGWELRWTPFTSPLGGSPSSGTTLGTGTLAPGGRVTAWECYLSQPPAGDLCGGSMPWGALGLLDLGAFVELLDPAGNSADFVRYGASSDTPSGTGLWSDDGGVTGPASGASIGRHEGAADTNSGADWCAQVRTPGSRNGSCQ